MNITVTPSELSGAVTPPPSKSQAHRLLIAAALAHGESVITNVAFSQDIEATIRCLEELGAGFAVKGSTVTVRGMGANAMSPLRRMAYPHLDCGESGSTLRFLIPIALAVRGGGIFTGRGRLMERPLKPYFDLFDEKGIFYEQKDGVLTVSGMLTPGEYRLPGDVSSQFFTGLLFALPLLNGPSAIVPTPPLESEGYIQMTLQAMAQFGVELPVTLSLPPQYHPQGNQTYQAADVAVEGDWSQGGFWYAAMYLSDMHVDVRGLNYHSTQGDRVMADYFDQFFMFQESFDVSGCPDLAPPLAVMAALRGMGPTRLANAARLRMKESDRLTSITAVLSALGADIQEGPDSLTIQGKERLAGGVKVDSFNDHRIAMMAAIAATRCEKPVTITGAQCVAKSYPNFWEELERLGGKIQREYELSLAPIGPDNWKQAALLTTDKARLNPLDQQWVTSNAFSLLQAAYDPAWTCRLILSDGKPVGFAFFGLWEERGSVPLLCRYMIDVDCQGRGLGRQALPLVLDEMYALYGPREIYLTVEPGNTRAVRLYEGFGFRPTGEFDCTEAVYVRPAPSGNSDHKEL